MRKALSRRLPRMVVCAMCMATAAVNGATIYSQRNLVSDIPGMAVTTDALLVNPWGMSFGPTSPFWLSNQGTNTSTLYNGAGAKQALEVSVAGGPTGQVFNNSGGGFTLANGNSAVFIFATLSGGIAAWNGGNGTIATLMRSVPDAVYTGLAIAGSQLYAANLAGGSVDIFDSSFVQQHIAGAFTDPNLPSGYAPFNVENVGGNLMVAYAKVDNGEEVKGPGLGYVDEFTPAGALVRRVISNGPLNAPWGIAIAPANFGDFSSSLLIGNFGDGTVNAFAPGTGNFLGTLSDGQGNPIVIDGLWALKTRTGGAGVNTNAVYFAAGINDEADGLFGALELAPEPGTVMFLVSGLGVLAAWRVKKRS